MGFRWRRRADAACWGQGIAASRSSLKASGSPIVSQSFTCPGMGNNCQKLSHVIRFDAGMDLGSGAETGNRPQLRCSPPGRGLHRISRAALDGKAGLRDGNLKLPRFVPHPARRMRTSRRAGPALSTRSCLFRRMMTEMTGKLNPSAKLLPVVVVRSARFFLTRIWRCSPIRPNSISNKQKNLECVCWLILSARIHS